MIRFTAVLFLLWAGLLLGVSFVATPVKFMAKGLSMPVALEIGMVTFHFFNKIEWMFCFLIVLLTIWVRPSWKIRVCGWIIFSLLAFETFCLMPELDVRANNVIAGENAEPGLLHWLYIVCELSKLSLLLIGGWVFLAQEKQPQTE